MVEGHSVHRVATFHRQRLVGRQFRATSPNRRFTDGARAIDGKLFVRIEAVGKNLFAFFADAMDETENVVVVHVHFGMAGNWSVHEQGKGVVAPAPSETNRLRLISMDKDELVADLAAMTVQYGHGMTLYEEKRAKLGEDPLRDDANPESLWERVNKSKKCIGALLMDQSFFCGPGNIYRAEILFMAGIHPDTIGKHLSKDQFDCIWNHTVALLKRGYETGSILTVDPEEAATLGMPGLRRYIYNTAVCPRCDSRIQSWSINNRTSYACLVCQPRLKDADITEKGDKTAAVAAITPDSKPHVPFLSHCAPEPLAKRIRDAGYRALTVAELHAELERRQISYSVKKKRKSELVRLLEEEAMTLISSEAAAAEKALANESLAIEHVAELAPSQARRVRTRAAMVVREEEEQFCLKKKRKRKKANV